MLFDKHLLNINKFTFHVIHHHHIVERCLWVGIQWLWFSCPAVSSRFKV